MKADELQKWYTRLIGLFFVLVILSLASDYMKFGHRPETWHKMFHVLLGTTAIYYGWNSERFWKPFCLVNGAFFTYLALFGWVFPGFGGLDAFNRMDTILHSIVGLSGLLIGIPGKFK